MDTAPPIRSSIDPGHFGLGAYGHVPVDEPKPSVGGPSRVKMTTRLAARGYVFAHTPSQEAGLVHVLTNPTTARVADRPHRIVLHAYEPDGSVTTFQHIPNFAVLRRDGTVEVVDFARRSTLEAPARKRRDALLKYAYLADHGILYNSVDDVTLRVSPLHPNLEKIYALTKEASDREGLVAVRVALMRIGFPTTVADVRSAVRLPTGFEGTQYEAQYDRVMPTLAEMAVSGEIAFDHRAFLSEASVVTAGRLGSRG